MNQNIDLNWSQEEISRYNQMQKDVCQWKANGRTLEEIRRNFNINKSTIYSIIHHTIEGNVWGNDNGGPRGFLGDVDKDILISKIKIQAQMLNCLRTIDVLEIAVELKYQRYKRAEFLVRKLLCTDYSRNHLSELLIHMLPYVPSSSWFYDFAKENQIPIKTASNLEELRRKFCNCSNIRDFYLKNHADFTTTHPKLIWNADEASHTSSRHFKALVGSPLEPCIVSQTGPEPHFTTMYAFSASGEKMLPFIILPNIVHIPGSLSLDFQAIFATQNSGWMTSHLFNVWCVFFVSKISQIRMELPNKYRNQRCILIVDNHPSRINSTAIEFLLEHNIKIVTLPAHCSHVLQPFDVAVAASVKSKITRARLVDYQPRFIWEYNSKAMKARYSIVRAIVQSWEEIPSCTLLKGFEKSGIFPYDMNKGLLNIFTNQTVVPQNQNNTFSISNKDLSLPYNRLQIAQKNYGSIAVPNLLSIPKPTYTEMKNKLKFTLDLRQGILSSCLPNIYVERENNKWERVFGE